MENMKSLLSEDRALAVLGISRTTLYRLRKSKQISSYRVGGRVMFSEGQIAEFLSKAERKASDQSAPAAPAAQAAA